MNFYRLLLAGIMITTTACAMNFDGMSDDEKDQVDTSAGCSHESVILTPGGGAHLTSNKRFAETVAALKAETKKIRHKKNQKCDPCLTSSSAAGVYLADSICGNQKPLPPLELMDVVDDSYSITKAIKEYNNTVDQHFPTHEKRGNQKIRW